MMKFEATDIVGLKPTSPGAYSVPLYDGSKAKGTYVEVNLCNLAPGTRVFDYREYNPNKVKHVTNKRFVSTSGRTASSGLFCDYLVTFERNGCLCPVFIELGKTCSSPLISKKFEQLFCSQTASDVYYRVHDDILNASTPMEPARFLLIHNRDTEHGHREIPGEGMLHRDHPRIVKLLDRDIAGFSVFAYGGQRKIIKVARTIVEVSGNLDAEKIFDALPDAEIEPKISDQLHKRYKALAKAHHGFWN